jgi:hypothetical protein
MLLQLLMVILCVEATTNILSKSVLFESLRKYLFESKNSYLIFIHNILDCPYCTSVWVSFFYTFIWFVYIKYGLPFFVLLFFLSIAVHRVSNIVHFIIDRLDEYHGFNK